MKKILLLSLISVSSYIFAQETVASYTMNYFPGEKYDIQSDNPSDNRAKLYLDVASKESLIKKIDILIPFNEIDKFKSDILKCKDIYSTWKKTAIENKVTDLDKEIDVKFNKYDIAFLYGSKWNIDFSKTLISRFKIVNGKYLFILSNEYELTASSNKYMTAKGFYLVLTDEKEFDNLINNINVDKINELFSAKKKTDELFK